MAEVMLCSDELRKKRSDAAKKRWSDPEFKKRVSAAMKGKACTNQTKAKLSLMAKKRLEDPEYKKKMSDSLKKKWQDPEYRKHQSEIHKISMAGEKHPMYGRKHSPESIKKMKENHGPYQCGAGHPMFGKTHTDEVKRRLSEAHKGVPLSEEHKAKIGIASKAVWANISDEKRKEWGGRISQGEKGKVMSIESRGKISRAQKGRRHSPKTEFTSETMKARYQDPFYVEKMRKAWNIKPNKAEVRMLQLLNDLYPGEWKYTGDFSFVIDGKCPDFVNCNGQKKIIEYWGDHWHKGENPQDRIDAFEPFGYETLVIWGHEMKDIESVIAKISVFAEAQHG